MSQNLTSKTIHGVKWTTTATVASAIMQIGYTSIMARLLSPEAFGLVAMSQLILRFGSYFSNMGMGQALIQKKDLSEYDIRSAFSFSILLSLTFFGLTWLLAPFAKLVFDTTDVIPVVRFMALSFIITGLTSTSHSLLKRQMDFKFIATTEILTYIIGYGAVGIGAAYAGLGFWSLILASMAQALLTGAFCYLKVRHSITPLFQWKYYKPLFAFGSKVSFISFLEFLTSNFDTLLIGRILGAAPLGIYNRAYMLIQLPVQNLTTSISKVLFPALSAIQNQTDRSRKVYLSSLSLVGFIILPACIGASVAAEEIVLVLLGDQWTAAIPIFQILAYATPFNLLAHFGGIISEANNQLNIKVYFQVFFLLFLGLLFYALKDYGLVGFASAIAIAMFVKNLAYIFITKSFLHFTYREIIYTYLPSILTTIITGLAIYATKIILSTLSSPLLVMLLTEISVGALCLVVLLFTKINTTIRKEINERFIDKAPLIQNSFVGDLLKVKT